MEHADDAGSFHALLLIDFQYDFIDDDGRMPIIADRQIEQVRLAGLFARACVAATARGAIARGLQLQLLVDAIACKSNESRSSALTRLARSGMQLVAGGSDD